jgi:hypothetical protein
VRPLRALRVPVYRWALPDDTGPLREYPALRVHSAPGAPLAWDVHARHSQGVLEAPRTQLIDAELERIARYTAKGDLVPAREVLAYLEARDHR